MNPCDRTIQVGETLQYHATVFNDTNGKSFEPTKGLDYCSSDSAVATVSAHGGLVTAIAPGVCTISAGWHGYYARAELTVIPAI
jgi:uncharacterized protein YjdB